ncbi:acyl-[ACP]--phospholipid O-acyltransferase [Curvivirga sp.]|uniref:acyl-[ACP]--phospholipid O-acyltransferase n=1 Tax=Curvivirga sp. TaxID=2856848 RepID=UPI003B5AA2C1
MGDGNFNILGSKRFLPLFLTQFLGAMNDNVFKNALVILIVYKLADQAGLDGQLMITLAAGIFILPFFLFSALAGQIADRFEKSRLISFIKFAEILIMIFGAYGIFFGQPYFLLFVLFLMGLQSTSFGPVKYSILPDHLKEDELLGGNALIEAGTFLAILIGTIFGGLYILGENGALIISIAIVGFAILGWLTSLPIPKTNIADPDLKINLNFLGQSFKTIALARERKDVFLSIMGISWFWLVGATFLAQFPNLAKGYLGANEEVVTLFLAVFSIGIAIGSMICHKLLKGEISAQYVPLGAVGMSIFIIDLYFAVSGYQPTVGQEFIGAYEFIGTLSAIRIIADLVAIAICAGLFIVPLYAIMQNRSSEQQRSRIVAANNILNAAFMVVGALAATVMLAVNLSVIDVFLILGILNAFVAVYICGLLPDAIVKMALKVILKLCYKVEVKGLEHYKTLDEKAVIVVNHVSFLDAVLLAVFLPRKPTFAVDSHVAQSWWIQPFLKIVDAYPMDPTNPMAIKSLIKAVDDGRHCVIFPEGRITTTGALMKIYEGPGLIADKANAPMVPIRIDGAQYTIFSRLKGTVRRRLFAKITITIQEPRQFEIPAEVFGRERRQMASQKLYDVMTTLIFETQNNQQTLFETLLDTKAIHGASSLAVEDIERKPLSYKKLVLGSLVLGRKLKSFLSKGEVTGVLLPNSVGASVVFFALQAFGYVPAMLNFSTGSANLVSACQTGKIKKVLTSRRFIELGKLEDLVDAISEHTELVYLEDIKQKINFLDKIVGLLSLPFAGEIHKAREVSSEDPAVILFTSGSEGVPKGVVLSHQNLLSNRFQLAACVDFNPKDIVFNALPIFHSFGLTGGMLLPILSGIKTFLYPSPLHYRIVPALVYDSNATIMFGTDTFLTGYAKVAHPYDFYAVRYVFAGAEKVKDETRRVWSEKFGLRILEGYGATETSPVLSTNTAMHFKAGTVGRLMPGLKAELEPVPGIEEGGKLIVSGPNVMKGYMLAEKPGEILPPLNGRYDTGDIVDIDAEGFVTIKGRAKRFAKIAGEMVSLGAVETFIAKNWSDQMHAVVTIPDPKKGEALVLVTENAALERKALSEAAKSEGMVELMIPKQILTVDQLPVLGTGKTDYVSIQKLVDEELG